MAISCFVPKFEVEEHGVLGHDRNLKRLILISYIIKTWQNNLIGVRMYGRMKLLISCLKFWVGNAIG